MKKEKIVLARNFAKEWHGNQQYGDYPYVYHLDSVYELACTFGLSENVMVASYLHDLFEDTRVDRDLVKETFGNEVYMMVDAVTGVGKNRKEKLSSVLLKIEGNYDAINLKMVDRLANMKESFLNNQKLFKMYCDEFVFYEKVFNNGDKNVFSAIIDLSGKTAKRSLNNF